MMSTLKPDYYILVSKYSYNFRTPEYYPLTDVPFPYYFTDGLIPVKRGDLVVLDIPILPNEKHPTALNNYVKRCIGVPGDTLLIGKNRFQMKNNAVSSSQSLENNLVRASMIIPKKGNQIILSDSTKKIWESIIIRDGNELKIDSQGNRWVNGIQTNYYDVRQDYFFVQGDNYRFSDDSRNWGLVPKQNLIGRVEMILWPLPFKLINNK